MNIHNLGIKKRPPTPAVIQALSDDAIATGIVLWDVEYRAYLALKRSEYYRQIIKAECLGPIFERTTEQKYQRAKGYHEMLVAEHLTRSGGVVRSPEPIKPIIH